MRREQSPHRRIAADVDETLEREIEKRGCGRCFWGQRGKEKHTDKLDTIPDRLQAALSLYIYANLSPAHDRTRGETLSTYYSLASQFHLLAVHIALVLSYIRISLLFHYFASYCSCCCCFSVSLLLLEMLHDADLKFGFLLLFLFLSRSLRGFSSSFSFF